MDEEISHQTSACNLNRSFAKVYACNKIPLYGILYIHICDTYVHALCIEERPTMKQLQEVMRIEDIDIITQWRDLGLELVDSNKILKVIEANHPSDVNTCCRLMFEKWLEKTPDASWSQLIIALSNIDMNTAADAVSKLFKSGIIYHIHLRSYIKFLIQT